MQLISPLIFLHAQLFEDVHLELSKALSSFRLTFFLAASVPTIAATSFVRVILVFASVLAVAIVSIPSVVVASLLHSTPLRDDVLIGSGIVAAAVVRESSILLYEKIKSF